MTENLPYLAEHQPFLKDEEEILSPPEQSPEEKKAAKLVDRLFEKEKKRREKYDSRWIDFYKYFRGDHWHKKRASYLHQECINFIFEAIQSQVPVLTEARPRPSFLPRDPSDLEFSEVLTELLDADWQHGNWNYKIAETLYDGHIYSVGYGKLFFDSEKEFGLGRICLKSADPFYQYPDSNSSQINDDDNHYIEAETLDIEVIKRKYAGHKYVKWIKPDLVSLDSKQKSGIERSRFLRNYDKQMPKDSYASDGWEDQDKVLVVSLYIRPTEVVEEEKETLNDLGEVKKEYVTKKKYPKGRKLVKINEYIFEDSPLDNEDLKFPFSKYTNYILPHEPYGISEIEQLESPQKIFNKLISFSLDVLTITGNPVWLIPTGSGVKPGSFTNAPGMQIPYDGDRPPQRQEGTQPQPYVLQLIDRVEQWFNGIAGNQDVMQGKVPQRVSAASAIEDLQNAAYTRIRQKARNLDSFMISLGEQYVSLVLQNYTVPRIFRLTNKDGIEKYFKFHVEPKLDEAGNIELDDKGDPIRKAIVTKFSKTDYGLVPDAMPSEYLVRGSFDVKVNTGAGLPFAKAEKEQRLLSFFDRGIIDREEVLKQSDYSNYEAVLQRINEAEAQAAQAQTKGL